MAFDKYDIPTRAELEDMSWCNSTLEIAQYYRVTESTVYKWFRTRGVDTPDKQSEWQEPRNKK